MNQSIPTSSGLYFVTLAGDELVPVDRNPRRIESCIKVNCLNSKFGKAENLRSRYRAYQGTFGAARVTFEVLLETHHHHEIEQRLKAKFEPYLMRGRSRRANEWLYNIEPSAARAIAKQVCAEADLIEVDGMPEKAPVPPLLEGQASSNPDRFSGTEIVKALEYLQQKFFSKSLIVLLHHSKKRSETVGAALNYFRKFENASFKIKNRVYGQRLIFVATAHQQRRGTFPELTDQAIQEFPLSK